MIQRYLLCLFLIFAVIGCSKSQNDLRFEQKVFYEVVPKIIDLQFGDLSGKYMIPKILEDSTSVWVEETSVNTILGIRDSVYEFNSSFYEKYVNQHFSNMNLTFDATSIGKKFRLDITKLEKKEDYDYKYLSEVPGPQKRYERSKDFYLLGLMGFSRIQFDDQKKFGILDFTANCGQQCGVTALVYIKNNNEIWEIDEIEPVIYE
ncbi:hypothetical protein J0X14_09095 [Muricauda sp. CAU 1633]|uniref:hypothetical protein n=1 Tax=Allomuricauda sp. CAU 1633 TaxID=2816036 RepID=UPI001A90325E|nr:hypothetical protein [Muricauda sp. CAU 1633]MBO0322452.1 hypothetical protein [Muricauda sp. CAU 1633]